MKKTLYIMMAALLALVSCAKVQEDSGAVEHPVDVKVVFGTKVTGSGSADRKPIINSMRVLIFYGDPAEDETPGNMVFNSFYAFGFDTVEGAGKYTVSLANPIVLPKSSCRNYNLYVVLNEEGFSLSGSGEDLHAKLGDFDGTESLLTAILETPAVYEDVLKNVDEPAFLISGMKAVTFSSGELGDVKTVTIEADSDGNTADFNRGRSMAQIVVKKITSEPAPDGEDDKSSSVPLIFVKSVTLENVPNGIAWSGKDGDIEGGTLDPQQVGAAKTHDDGSYYDRVWYGQVTRTISNLWAKKAQYTDAKFYRTGDNSDNGSKATTKWSFCVKPYASSAPKTYSLAQKADNNENAFTGLSKWDNGNDASKSSKKILATQLPEVFAAMQGDEGVDAEMSENITSTVYEISGVQDNGGNKTSIGPITVSDDYWTVNLGDSFYVPENISSTPGNATFLRVRLAIAQPVFSFRLNDKDDGTRIVTEDGTSLANDKYKQRKNNGDFPLIQLSDLPSPSSLPGENESSFISSYQYYMEYDQIKYDNKTGATHTDVIIPIADIGDKITKSYGRIAWADDAEHILDFDESWYNNKGELNNMTDNPWETHSGGFHAYLDGFCRKSEAVQAGDITVSSKLKGAKFGWGVPDSDDSSTHVYDFLIPVNNNLGGDGDYSVRRNTKYTVTLHVNGGTYDSLITKAGEAAPISVTAIVTTEKVDSDEK